MISAVSQTKSPSRILRYLPGRLVVAWAVLGAAAAVGLMYFPPVFSARTTALPMFTALSPYEGRVRVLGVVVYDERSPDHVSLYVTVQWWLYGVMAGFALLGALVGVIIGRREERRWRRGPTDTGRGGWLWLAASAFAFTFLVCVGVPGDVDWSVYERVRFGLRYGVPAAFRWSSVLFGPGEVARLMVAAVAIGWAVHVALVARGVQWMGGRQPDQAADYGDDVVEPTSG